MNAKDLLAEIEAHAAVHGPEPIYLDKPTWQATKQTFMLAYGEGSMFPALGYPESFVWRGTPVVFDHEGDKPVADAAKAIAALAVTAGPREAPLALHPDAPQAKVHEGQPRPELDGQVAIEHFADEDGVFSPPKPSETRAIDPDIDGGGSSLVPDGPGERTEEITGPEVNDPSAPPPAPRTAEEAPEPTGTPVENRDDADAADHTLPAPEPEPEHHGGAEPTGFAAMSQRADAEDHA